jgi:hypothetical protein
MRIKQTPGGSWQEVKLVLPGFTSLGIILLEFYWGRGVQLDCFGVDL